MAWFRVDDGFFSSKPVLRVPRRYRTQAVGLWLLAGTWSAQEELDGFVPEYVLEELCGTPNLAGLLTSVGLWENVVSENSKRGLAGWQFVNWGKYQPTKAELDAAREKERIRKANYRASQRDTSGTDAGQTTGHHPESEHPDPTRPDPVNTSPNGEVKEKSKRGTRMSADYMPTEAMVAEARGYAPNVDLKAEHAVFVDWWVAVPGQRGLKLDWPATWRNWMKKAEADLGKGRARFGSSTPKPTPMQRLQDTRALAARLASDSGKELTS